MAPERQHAYELIDRLAPGQLTVVVKLLEVMTQGDEEERLDDEDRRAIAASREYFRQGGKGLSLEEVAAECGITMSEIQGAKSGV